jgi:hypothetical protein
MRKTNVETLFWRESAMGSCGSLRRSAYLQFLRSHRWHEFLKLRNLKQKPELPQIYKDKH